MSHQAIDKNLLKAVLEEILAERNPRVEGLLEEILVKILSARSVADRTFQPNTQDVLQKYRLRREAFYPLQEIFKDAPPASEMVKLLRK